MLLSLLVAATFILSAVSSLASNVSVNSSTVEKDEAVDIYTTQPTKMEKTTLNNQKATYEAFKIDTMPLAMDDDGCFPVDITEIRAGTIPLVGAPTVIATGTYPLSITLSRPEFCVDVPWYLFTKDCIQEAFDPINPWPMQPMDVEVRCDINTVGIRFSGFGYAPDLVKIRLKGDLGNRWYTSSIGDASGGTILYWGANQIPGSTVVRTPIPQQNPSVVEITIPREDPASGIKYWAGCCDSIEWYYYVYNWLWPVNENRGGWNADFCDCDMYPVTIKKFIEVYKWVDPITDPPETIEIFCEDFEDPCQIVDLWYVTDHTADGDTWQQSTARFASPGNSMHNTQFAFYLPNAHDSLTFDNGGGGLDVAGYDELIVKFQHWMEGDKVGATIYDYGEVYYSFTGAFAGEEVLAAGPFYDNDWEEVQFTIDVDPVNPADDTLFIRFTFKADPAFCNEGWYVDDMCVYGVTTGSVIAGWWEFVHDSHSPKQTFDTEFHDYEFPDPWVVTEEGLYMVCAWTECIDECHYSLYPFENPLCVEVLVDDVLELALDCASMTVSPSSPADEGDDVTIEVDIENIGTLPATEALVRTTVKRGSVKPLFDDNIEGAGALDFNDVGDRLNNWFHSAGSTWQCRSDYNFITSYISPFGGGSSAIANFDDSGAPPYGYQNLCPNGSEWVASPLYWTGADATAGIEADIDVTYSLGPGEDLRVGIIGWEGGWVYTSAVASGGSYSDWTTITDIPISDLIDGYLTLAGTSITDGIGLCFLMYKDGAGFSSGLNPDPWDGYIIDNMKVRSLQEEPGIIFEETKDMGPLALGATATASFTWPNAGVGQYLIYTEIITPDADATNNLCMQGYNVINIIIELDGDVVITDNTGGDSHWMVEGCCGGYLWCGDPATMQYGNNWDDSLYLLDPTDGDRTFDCAGLTPILTFDYQMEVLLGDCCFTEYSNDDGVTWTDVAGCHFGNIPNFIGSGPVMMCDGVGLGTATMQFRFRFTSNDTGTARGWFIDNVHITGSDIFGPDDCTTMNNFEAEATQYGAWWQTPNIYEWYRSSFDLSTTGPSWTALRNLYIFLGYGNYWGPGWDYLGPWPGIGVPPGWTGDPGFPWNVIFGRPEFPGMFDPSYGVYDPGWTGPRWDSFLAVDHAVPPGQNRPWMGTYPDNIDTSMIWTIDIPGAFYGWLDGCLYWDLENGYDFGYFQISSDGGTSYSDISGPFTGATRNFGDNIDFAIYKDPLNWECGPWDITPHLVNPEIKIKWTQTSDSYNAQVMAGLGNMWTTFYGMADNNPPVTTCTLQGDKDPLTGWYIEEVAVFLEATDDVTGVKEIKYTVDGGAEQTYTGPFLVTGDGTHKVCYYAIDNEDNVEAEKCTAEFMIDTTGPSVEITGPTPGLYLCDSKLLDASKIIALFCGITITATASADDAPLIGVDFYMNDVFFGSDTTAPFSLMCKEKNSGSATFKVVATDLFGRTAEDTLTVDTYLKLL